MSKHLPMLAVLLSAGLARIPQWREARTFNAPASKRGNTGVPAARREGQALEVEGIEK